MNKTITKLLGGVLCALLFVPVNASATITATWDWKTDTPTDIQSVNFNGNKGYVESDVAGVSMFVDASAGKLQGSSSGHAQFNAGTKLRIPVVSTSDVVTFVANSYNYKGVTIGNEDFEAGDPVVLTRTHTATAEDVAQGYVLITSKGDYLNTVTVELAYLPAVRKDATWDFTGSSSAATTIAGLSGTSTDEAITVNGLKLVVNANGAVTGDNTNSIYTYPGATFHVPVISEEDVVTVFGFSGYCEYSVGGIAATEATTVYNPTPTDVSNGFVEIVNGLTKYSYLKSIEVIQKTFTTATVSAYEWATYSNTAATDFTSLAGVVDAYIIKGSSGSAVTKESVTTAAGGTGLLLNAEEGTYAIPLAALGADLSDKNQLVAVSASSSIGASADASYTNYVLSVSGGKATFMSLTGATTATVGAGKAYLHLNTAGGAPYLYFDDESADDNTTAINNDQWSTVNEQPNTYYNIAGQRVAQPTKGLYIVNGKKFIVK